LSGARGCREGKNWDNCQGGERAVARPGEKDREYIRLIEGMGWAELRALWDGIKRGTTPGWDEGKALEHLVVRGFKLGGLDAEYPYHVPPGGQILEQIDGVVFVEGHCFLLECKDESATDIEAISKLRIQLLRRPESTLGCVFTRQRFTRPALILTDLSIPHRILLWSDSHIEDALRKESFATILREKYRYLCMYGLEDHSPFYKELEVT
jgi:hypothetical protein